MKFRLSQPITTETIAATTAYEPVPIANLGADSYSVMAVVDVNTPAGKTFDSGESQINTFTFDSLANTEAGDYMVVYDTAGLAWAGAADVTGTDPEPTGAVWVSIPAAQKVMVDISGATDAASVAALFETALNALTDVPFVADDSGGAGALAVTVTLRGETEVPEVHNEDDSGAGSITVVVTDAGVASEVDIVANSVTIPSHGFAEGLKGQLTTTGTLPAGVTTGVDYYIIPVDSNTIQFAASLADAQAGTPIDLTNQGSDGAVNTFTATALAGANIKLQQTNSLESGAWVDLGSATNITADANIYLEKDRPTSGWVRTVITMTAGQMAVSLYELAKGDRDV